MKIVTKVKQLVSCRAVGAKFHGPKLITGEGSLFKVTEQLKETGKTSVMIMTSPGFIKRGTLEAFFQSLEANGIEYTVFSEVMPDPTVECVEAAAKYFILNNCDAVIAIGGGSVIDCAKISLARVARPDLQIIDMMGALKIQKEIPALYAVPTTAGTGSETTLCAVVTDVIEGRPYKYPISDFCILPTCAVLDPGLSVSMPESITAATGMDALTHAVEAYSNRFASAEVNRHAKTAVKLIFENIYEAYEDGSDIKARMNMLIASYEAGIAFTTNYVGYVHAVAHGIGALYGVPHGKANAIILPYVMEQFGSSAEKRLNELAAYVGLKDAAEFIEAIRQFNSKMEIPEKIKELKEEDFETIIDRALAEAYPAYPVPQFWKRDDFRKILGNLKA